MKTENLGMREYRALGAIGMVVMITLLSMPSGIMAQSQWVQTTQTDFEAGDVTDLDIESDPGSVTLAMATLSPSGGNPVLDVGPPSSWDEFAVQCSFVMWIDTELKMWYQGASNSGQFMIGYANSTDGIIWNRHGSPVLANGSSTEWDGVSVGCPSVLWDGAEYTMYYSGLSSFSNWRIGVAFSSNGIQWNKYDDPATSTGPYAESDPILDWGPDGSWEDWSVAYPLVLFEDGEYQMWYSGHDGGVTSQIGYANSPDGIHWTKYPSNPVLTPGPAAWDSVNIGHSYVISNETGYHMWYNGHGGGSVRIGYATSSDGIVWQKSPQNPALDLGDPGLWDDNFVARPRVIFRNEELVMYYTGAIDSRQRIGVAFSANGTEWTREVPSYLSPGILESPVFDSGTRGTRWLSLNWTGSVPDSTSIAFSIRTGDADAPDGEWTGWCPEQVTHDISITMPRTRRIQYRATLESQQWDAAPVLEEITIYYELNQASPPMSLSPGSGDEVASPVFSWLYGDPEGDNQSAFVVEVDDQVDFTSIDYTSGEIDSSNASWEPDKVISTGEWYWRVRTKDDYGLWESSNPVQFQVVEERAEFRLEDYWWIIMILILVVAIVLAVISYSRRGKKKGVPQEAQKTDDKESSSHTQPEETLTTDRERLQKLETRYGEGHISEETYSELKKRYGGESD